MSGSFKLNKSNIQQQMTDAISNKTFNKPCPKCKSIMQMHQGYNTCPFCKHSFNVNLNIHF